MRQNKRKLRKHGAIIGSGILLLLAAVGLTGYRLSPAGPTQAPDLQLTTLGGDRIALQHLRGRPVLINFWATSCAQCVRELPLLIELYQRAAPRRLEIIGITMQYDRPDHVLALSRTKQLPYPVALDIDGLAARSFGDVQLTPAFFLIAPDGSIVHRSTGFLDTAKIHSMLNDMASSTGSTLAAQVTK